MNIRKTTPIAGSMLVILMSGILTGCNSDSDKNTDPATNSKPTTDQAKLVSAFPLSTKVFGISIRGTSGTKPESIKYAANVMAQYLDNDGDGNPDNGAVVDKMVEKGATLLIGTDENDFEKASVQITPTDVYQDLHVSEMRPNGASSGQFDATLEEVLHLITHVGYANVYPSVFGEKSGSEIANAMDIARGGHFETIPTKYPADAWYSYDDKTCSYDCMITEYTYWALTSILGAQQFDGRLAEIQHEWKLNTKQKVKDQDPAVYDILTNSAYALATTLPNGNYKAIDFKVTGKAGTPSADGDKKDVFAYINEQTNTSIAVYGSKTVEQAAYERAHADVGSVMAKMDRGIKEGLLNSGAKLLVVSNDEELEGNIDFFQSLLPVEAIFTSVEGVDETLPIAEHGGLSATKLELMYLCVYYSLLTEDGLSDKYTVLKQAYDQATTRGLFTPGEAYRDGYVDEIHQNASDEKALKYGSYLFNLYKLYFGDDSGVAGEFTITTKAQLASENPLGYSFISENFDKPVTR